MAASSSDGSEVINVGIRSIHVKTTTLEVPQKWSVGQLKTKVRTQSIIEAFKQANEVEQLRGKAVRIIYHGRDLNDQLLLSDAGIRDGSIVHVSVSNASAPTRRAAPARVRPNVPVLPDSDSESDSDDELNGFDRLQEMGFSPEEVQEFRAQFYLNHFRNMPAGQAHPAPQSPEMIRLENQWIDAQFNPRNAHNAPAGNAQNVANATMANQTQQTLDSGLGLAQNLVQLGSVDGNGFNLFFGMMTGFLLGLLILFWVGEPHLTRKTRLGMFFGLFANLAVGIVAYTR